MIWLRDGVAASLCGRYELAAAAALRHVRLTCVFWNTQRENSVWNPVAKAYELVCISFFCFSLVQIRAFLRFMKRAKDGFYVLSLEAMKNSPSIMYKDGQEIRVKWAWRC